MPAGGGSAAAAAAAAVRGACVVHGDAAGVEGERAALLEQLGQPAATPLHPRLHARQRHPFPAGRVGLRHPDLEELLAFHDYPAEHWIHLGTTNPIESTFATVRHRTKITRGPGSRAAGLAMAFKLIQAAQDRWRAVNAPHLVALVRAGATFVNGELVERPEETSQPEAA